MLRRINVPTTAHLAELRELLAVYYTAGGIEWWLRTPNARLSWQKPIDVILDLRGDDVVGVARRWGAAA